MKCCQVEFHIELGKIMQNCISKVKVKMNDNLGVHSQKLKKKSSSLKENKNFIFIKKVNSQENKKVFFTVFVTGVSSVQL